ncbi:CPBP family intramembrane metalloprotease [Pseudoclavibacter chungangensis]|uniref:CPBP family intramembrane metalloprotease n=1 Tax=Pseudoclavibacter chungangensis TaxID=587635 RepID=A0A7J5BNZ8_9MICO|nr:CPBP family intramembrane glutamic endopeptidase [Pseudoclavibacter chungangensis]KAB1654281.1 CPBP family intramembrane metalloprotease [Pseudoclavibacter chungangensis]NYJ65314.1 membrane protease YdiL (CAAX protease family) [Pseudoclavibacter chungangensis]
MRSAEPAITLDDPPTLRWGILPAVLVSGSAVLLFAMESSWGYVPLVVGVVLAFVVDRPIARDLLLIAVGMGIVSIHSMRADLGWINMLVIGTVLSAAVFAPYAISRWGYRERAIRFELRGGRSWSTLERGWLLAVLVLGWLLLPWYFITSGAYLNWPAVETPSEIARLFVGVGFVGIWDELFFVCTVFVLYRRHFPMWIANLLQATVFVSFLWELGYREWGPLLTIPFALVQAWLFTKTGSLLYVICVHLLFDVVVFLTLLHAHHPGWLPIFLV